VQEEQGGDRIHHLKENKPEKEHREYPNFTVVGGQ